MIWLDKTIRKTSRTVERSFFLRCVLPAGSLLFLLFYYAPILPVLSNLFYLKSVMSLWMALYEIFSPFLLLPYLMGFLTVLVFMGYHSWFFKTAFTLFYGISILFSMLSIMGMTQYWHLVIFAPHLFFAAVCIVVGVRKLQIC